MTNPYRSLPDFAFWRRAVVDPAPDNVDPVTPPPFKLGTDDSVATAGSCFAQHIARTLKEKGFRYLETETGPLSRSFGVFSARFGNIYTARQLLQLFQRAYGLFESVDKVWRLSDGRFVDPFRPQVEPGGYETAEEVARDRREHLAAVRRMFEDCDVFIFTLGLTEGWRSKLDGAVFPLAPGVAGSPDSADDFEFHNFTAGETIEDLRSFIGKLRVVNPGVKLIFTVSPVPLVATYEPRHVLVSTIYSKSVLRVAAEEIVRSTPDSAYYPSYEIITGHHGRYKYFGDDLRTVTNVGVDRAMALFSEHYLENSSSHKTTRTYENRQGQRENHRMEDFAEELYHIICDEEAIDK